MAALSGKKILLGITGGIAAYKSILLLRLLVKAGAEVRVILTPSAKNFVSPLSLSVLSNHKVYTDFYDEKGIWNDHVHLGLWADLFVIAPLTANTLSKMAVAQADNFLLGTYLSTRCPIIVAPAMDVDMYKHIAVQKNLSKIKSHNVQVIPAEKGFLASGLEGEGRMAEPETIFKILSNQFDSTSKPLSGKTVLITAGPTYEKIDPVRFIGNFSSGKMGYALAENAVSMGANVILISGPSALAVPSGLKFHGVISAEEMFDAVIKHYSKSDIVIAAAAVADYRPVDVSCHKIKKNTQNLTLELTKNKDILAHLGQKKTHQLLIGFALETEKEEIHAKEKLLKKNLDMIVLNSLNDKGAGFKTDTNKVSLITSQNIEKLALMPKKDVAKVILEKISTNFF